MEDKKRLGCFWEKTSKKGNKFLSGKLNLPDGTEVSIVAFKSFEKAKDTSPDWTIYEATKQTGYQLPLATTQPAAPKAYTDDDIPDF